MLIVVLIPITIYAGRVGQHGSPALRRDIVVAAIGAALVLWRSRSC